MRPELEELFCLACGVPIPEPLCRTASLRCLECRERGEPISFELALRAREVTRRHLSDLVDSRRAAGLSAA